MNRRFNYTGRKRIERKHVDVTILRDGDGPPAFDAGLRLDEYALPPEAPVYLEAYRQTAWMRFELGTAGGVRLPPMERRRLTQFGSADGVNFRVKVIEPSGADGRPARIIAHSDGISPQLPGDERDKAESLLPVVSGDLQKNEVWCVQYYEGEEPVLVVDQGLVQEGERDALLRSSPFLTLALPAVFRDVLARILFVEQHVDTEDPEDWRSQWLRFARQLPGMDDAPDEKTEMPDRAEWIDEAVRAFGRESRVADRFLRSKEDKR